MHTRDALLISYGRSLLRSGRAAEIRHAAGLSQVDVALVCGVSPSAVCLWEAGRRLPTREPAMKLARLLRALEAQTGDRSDRASGAAHQSDEPALTGSLADPVDQDDGGATAP